MKTILQLITIYFAFNMLFAQVILYNQEFPVNPNDNFMQYKPCVSALSNGSFIICWEKTTNEGIAAGISAQIFGNDCSAFGQELSLSIDTLTLIKWTPKVASLKDGGFVASWQSYNPVHFGGWDIFSQLFDNMGHKKNNEFRVNTNLGVHTNADLCALEDSGFVITWRSYDSDDWGIFCQMYNQAGLKEGEEFQVNDYTNSFQAYPAISSLSDGGFAICWTSDEQDTDGYGIFCKIYDNNGAERTGEFQINTYSQGDQRAPRICSFYDNTFTICWHSSNQNNGNNGLYGQIFSNNGFKIGEEFQLNGETHVIYHDLSISEFNNDRFIICWSGKKKDDDNMGIYGQLFFSDGTKIGSEFQINTEKDVNQYYPSVCKLENKGFVLSWQFDGDLDNSSKNILAKYYLSDPISHSLNSFSLLEPAYDTTVNNINQKFKWEQVTSIKVNFPWELNYTLYLDEDESFSSSTVIASIYDTTYTIQNLIPGTTYFWKVLAKNIKGDSLWSSETNGFFVSHDATGIKHQNTNNKFQSFELYANYPNPFNPETTIKYNLPMDQSVYQVKAKIYDALGRLITTFINEPQNPGMHTVKWNGKNTVGQSMPSGIYFFVLEAGQYKATQKMLLVR